MTLDYIYDSDNSNNNTNNNDHNCNEKKQANILSRGNTACFESKHETNSIPQRLSVIFEVFLLSFRCDKG